MACSKINNIWMHKTLEMINFTGHFGVILFDV